MSVLEAHILPSLEEPLWARIAVKIIKTINVNLKRACHFFMAPRSRTTSFVSPDILSQPTDLGILGVLGHIWPFSCLSGSREVN